MRLLEILQLLLILPVLLWPLLPWRRPRWVDFLPGTAVLAMILHLLLEGYRWQMLPAYALVTVVFLLTLPRLWRPAGVPKKRSGWAAAGSVLGLLLWLLVLALPALLPVPRLPAATGPYAAGTSTFHLVDERREEIYTEDPGDKREIMVQLWYPADAEAEGEQAVYLPELDVMGPVLAERLGLPSFLLDHINLAKLDTRQDVPLAAGGPYPLLIFSHGLRGIRAQNTAMVRDLVSQGFVVATIDHTYGNVLTAFPDGRVVFYDPDLLSETGDPPRTSSLLLEVWAADIGFVVDQLAAWNETEGGAFNGRLDLTKVGAFGHSTGGGAAVEFCGHDARCQAGVGLDAWVEPVSDDIVAAGLAQPFMFMHSDIWFGEDQGPNFDVTEALFADAGGTSYLATIAGANHFDFSDAPLLSPLAPQLDLASTMGSGYIVGMMNSMTSAFFRQELLGEGDTLVLAAMVFPEMKVVGNGR